MSTVSELLTVVSVDVGNQEVGHKLVMPTVVIDYLQHTVGDSAATSVPSFTLLGDVHRHCRITV